MSKECELLHLVGYVWSAAAAVRGTDRRLEHGRLYNVSLVFAVLLKRNDDDDDDDDVRRKG